MQLFPECLGGSSGLHYAWLLPFQTAIKNSRIGQYIGCGAVYFFSIFLILLFMTFCFCCIWKLYKPLQERRSDREEEIVDVDYYINHQEDLLTAIYSIYLSCGEHALAESLDCREAHENLEYFGVPPLHLLYTLTYNSFMSYCTTGRTYNKEKKTS